MTDSTKLICMVELTVAGGFDWSDCRIVAEQFAEAELESRSGIDGLEFSRYAGTKFHFGAGIRYHLDQLRKLSAPRADKLQREIPCSLDDDRAPFWYSESAEELFDHLEEVIDELEGEVDEDLLAENPHHAEAEEARLSLHEREHDLDCAFT